jgi:formate hydrogenlyase subunit 6/NADH:ubiquinone oxidoreductase subunit I
MNGGTGAMKMTDSFILEDENQSNIYGTSHMNKVEQKERSRHRRSVVVDELASQIHSTVAVHN